MTSPTHPDPTPPASGNAGERQTYWLVFDPSGVPFGPSLKLTRDESMEACFGDDKLPRCGSHWQNSIDLGWTCREIDFARPFPTGTGDADVARLVREYRDALREQWTSSSRGMLPPDKHRVPNGRNSLELAFASLKARNAELERERDAAVRDYKKEVEELESAVECWRSRTEQCKARAEAAEARVRDLTAVAEAAREWVGDRHPKDWSECALFVALFDAFPADFPGRENCGCDQSEMECDECPSIHKIRADIEKWRAERAQIRASTPDQEDGR